MAVIGSGINGVTGLNSQRRVRLVKGSHIIVWRTKHGLHMNRKERANVSRYLNS